MPLIHISRKLLRIVHEEVDNSSYKDSSQFIEEAIRILLRQRGYDI